MGGILWLLPGFISMVAEYLSIFVHLLLTLGPVHRVNIELINEQMIPPSRGSSSLKCAPLDFSSMHIDTMEHYDVYLYLMACFFLPTKSMKIMALSITASIRNQLTFPSTNQWIKRRWCICTREYYLALERRKF